MIMETAYVPERSMHGGGGGALGARAKALHSLYATTVSSISTAHAMTVPKNTKQSSMQLPAPTANPTPASPSLSERAHLMPSMTRNQRNSPLGTIPARVLTQSFIRAAVLLFFQHGPRSGQIQTP